LQKVALGVESFTLSENLSSGLQFLADVHGVSGLGLVPRSQNLADVHVDNCFDHISQGFVSEQLARPEVPRSQKKSRILRLQSLLICTLTVAR